MLPDDVQLEILAIYLNEVLDDYEDDLHLILAWQQAWQTLVHVCRRWRTVVFGSPRRLNLRLVCDKGTPARDTLDVWPPLPLEIFDRGFLDEDEDEDVMDNIFAVLERSDRVDKIRLYNISGPPLERILEVMREPFPELTKMTLYSCGDHPEKVVPDSFLGGSPRLQELWLLHLAFPGLPKLLSSATHLNNLSLFQTPHIGYISPEAMVTALSALPGLERLFLGFSSPQSCPDRASRLPPPPKRAVLSALTRFEFTGVHEYLEDLVARMDTPRLKDLSVTFFNDIVFDIPQFIRFIAHTPMLKPLEKAHVAYRNDAARVNLSSRQASAYEGLNVEISCRELDWNVLFMGQVCTSCLPPLSGLSTLEDLYIYKSRIWPQSLWQGYDVEDTLWLELLHPFTAVKNLYICKEFSPRIMPILQELVGGRTTEVLPTLQNICLEGLEPSGAVQEDIGTFISARQLSGHPITVSLWEGASKR
jgi:hypothetical protein